MGVFAQLPSKAATPLSGLCHPQCCTHKKTVTINKQDWQAPHLPLSMFFNIRVWDVKCPTNPPVGCYHLPQISVRQENEISPIWLPGIAPTVSLHQDVVAPLAPYTKESALNREVHASTLPEAATLNKDDTCVTLDLASFDSKD